MAEMPSQARAREAFRLTNDFHHDLITGTQCYNTFQGPVFDSLLQHEHVRTGITRLCLFHLVVTLSKWIELYDRYHRVIPQDVHDVARDLRKEIERRGIVEYRNKVVGHIWDTDERRPLTSNEVENWLDKILEPDIPTFMLWVNDVETNSPDSVVNIVARTRDRIRATHGVTDADLA